MNQTKRCFVDFFLTQGEPQQQLAAQAGEYDVDYMIISKQEQFDFDLLQQSSAGLVVGVTVIQAPKMPSLSFKK